MEARGQIFHENVDFFIIFAAWRHIIIKIITSWLALFSKYKTVGFLVLASNETFLKHLKNGIEIFIFKCLNFQRKLYNVHWREKPLTNFWRNFLNHSINEAIWMHFRRKQSWLKDFNFKSKTSKLYLLLNHTFNSVVLVPWIKWNETIK